MALNFKNLKSPLLGMTDNILVGKLAGCRVCDVIPDHYEYLIWADKQGLLKFQAIVVETIAEHAGFKSQQQYYTEEVEPFITKEPKLRETNEPPYLDDYFDDIPF